MRKVTIEDISRDTGLSRGTVSRALNDRPDISIKTKQKVLETCRKLNYVPSHAARSLATGRNYAVAVLINDLQAAASAGYLRGITETAHQQHYAVHVIDLDANLQLENQLATLSPERIDAVLNMAPMNAETANLLRTNIEDRTLSSTCTLEGTPCDVFAPDHREAGRMAARFFLRNEAREILYVHMPDDFGATERLSGFQEICAEAGLNVDATTAILENMNELHTLTARFERAEAIAASNDFLAVSIMLACTTMGRAPGDDVAIMGYGNESVARSITPDLTTIDADSQQIGRRAMQTVLQRLAHEHDEPAMHAEVAPLLIRRTSTRRFNNV